MPQRKKVTEPPAPTNPKSDRAVLEHIMLVLGPVVPDVDYTVLNNVKGLIVEITEVLHILEKAGITYPEHPRKV